MSGLSLGFRYGVNNVIIPKNGPATIPALLDFTSTAEIEIDGELVVSQGQIEYLQGVFIDNADNPDTLTLTMGTTGQRIVCPKNSQGYFAIMVPNPPRIVAQSAQAGNKKIRLFFYNVPIQSLVWATQ